MKRSKSGQAVQQAYQLAREKYAGLGVDADRAIRRLAAVPLSLQCWQGDDVVGFEESGWLADGGILATGSYPGRARNADELRADLDMTFRLIPGRHRVNLHAIYAETGGNKVERNELGPEHFKGWMDWARTRRLGMDFNPSFFSHPKVSGGFTLASREEGIRRFWVEHGRACRRIGAAMGRALGTPCVNNVWIPDGYKDTPADRLTPRLLLKKSLDEIFERRFDRRFLLDCVEAKLFGLGSESFVAGSHEFYMAYAVQKGILLCLDSGHFHPTEQIADKISSVLAHMDGLMLHVSRGVRWDSDHVVTLNDEIKAIAEEIVRHDFLSRVHIGLDFFDASINRIAAWVIGSRSMLKALLTALLEPITTLRRMEAGGDFTARLALLEDLKTMPAGAVWDYYCDSNDVPMDGQWMAEVSAYEKRVLASRT
jgi:L-rhamnose isomerase